MLKYVQRLFLYALYTLYIVNVSLGRYVGTEYQKESASDPEVLLILLLLLCKIDRATNDNCSAGK